MVDGALREANGFRRLGRKEGQADRVANGLREAIVNGEIAPGCWLGEEAIAREYGVSRTPVREAFKALLAEGLLTQTGNRGVVVTSLSLDDLAALHAVRSALEGIAARFAAERGDQLVLERLRNNLFAMELAVASNNRSEELGIIHEFHELLRAGAANVYVQRFLTEVARHFRRLRRATYEEPGRGAEVLAQHTRIVEAIASRDSDAAESAAIEHQRQSQEVRKRTMVR